ncbi:MAG: polyprenyl synthetase family protein [bacterium]|nr:polyprenyl synthetase family protein [bacterium]
MNEYLDNLTGKINDALVAGLDPGNGVLEAAMHYSLAVKGKRLRPLLFLTLLEAYKINPSDYMDIACAIEMIHTYSLIHDDLPVMDNDDFRRGMPTVHKKYNEAIALLAGDTLLTYAFEKAACADIEPSKVVNILKILTRGIGKEGMAGGQALDLEFEGGKETILEIHDKKTAQLIKAALASAAEIIGLPETDKKIIDEVGFSIGVAFQMTDDLLDIFGNEEEVGKKLYKDDGNHSPNCVLFFGKDYVRKEIDSAYNRVTELLETLGVDFAPFLFLMKKMVYRRK